MPNNNIRAWKDLSQREKEQIQLMLFSLKEFSYGFEKGDVVASEVPAGSAILRFYMNALYQYCANYYLVGGAHKLKNILQEMGSGNLLEHINAILNKKLGETTFGQILKSYRDKFLVHQSFTWSSVEDKIHKKFNILEPSNAEVFQKLVNDLYAETQKLYLALVDRYPEAQYG
jgi:hypothetical protein